ncbi:transporter substrate-binding domain-containing protein [Azoarcus sp. KH32C]|uniref:transporter substrate-binding domain-containing protein n=1 Tax=Azoarcus sp. KH32C TaxID=748247 RepID=UPI00023860CF|nr:transporter substrate-binding domain-containing protein [Azoarcus sp. KH32C]BAL22434.1 putative ABC transporter, glutamate receptor [Azoarcus sp. KH32C]
MRKSLTRLALCVSVLGLALPAQAQLTGTLQKIKESGSITIGHRESSVPFSYLDAEQKPVGYAVDLCAKVVDAVKNELKMPNLKVNYQAVTSQNRIPLMQNGTIDMECGSTTNSVARQQQVGFSVAYFITSVRMAVRKDSGIKDIGDLNGKAVVTTTGTTSDQLIKQNEKGKSIDAKNIYGKDHADSFLMVESGRAAAFVMDDILLAGLIASSKNPANFAIVGPSLRDEPYAVMMRKDDAPFKALVDKTLVGLMKSGEAEKLYNKWFMSPVPPRNVNLNFPMSPAVKAAFQNPTDKGVE